MDPSLLVLTGMPRAGTTLAASLVDDLAGAVCLNEPRRYYAWAERCRTADDFVQLCVRDLRRVRSRLSEGTGILDDRLPDGRIPTNYYHAGGRHQLRPVRLSRDGGERLLVAVKHNELFMSVLDRLCGCTELSVVVLVRHPIPTLLSWQACSIPLSRGELSEGYRLWKEALDTCADGQSIVDVQARIYNLYCQRLNSCRGRITLLRYEDVAEFPSRFEHLTHRTIGGHYLLANQNKKHVTDDQSGNMIAAIRHSIERHGHDVAPLYDNLDEW